MNDKIEINFTIGERDLILNHTFADPEITDRLKIAEVKNKKIRATFSLDEIEDLAGFVAAEANHSIDRKLQKQLDKLYDKLSAIEDKYS